MYFDLTFFPDFYDMKVFSFNYFRWLYFPGEIQFLVFLIQKK